MKYTVYMDMRGASMGGGAIWWSDLDREAVDELLAEWGVDPAEVGPGQEIKRSAAPFWVRVSDGYKEDAA
jgi:hypothetical protein